MAYFSNGSDGMALDDQCQKCELGKKPCPVYQAQVEFNYSQYENEKLKECLELLVDKKGRCRMKPLIDELETPVAVHDDRQMEFELRQ